MKVIKNGVQKGIKYLGECNKCLSEIEWESSDIKFLGFFGIHLYVKCPVCDGIINAENAKKKTDLDALGHVEKQKEAVKEMILTTSNQSQCSIEWLPTGIEAQVCVDIAKRQEFGINKYGKTVAEDPLELRGWLQHAYEESLDKAIYLRRAIAEIDKQQDDFK